MGGTAGEGAGGGAAGGAGGDPGAAATAQGIADFTTAFCNAARTCCVPVPGASALLADCETILPSKSMRYAGVLGGTIALDPTLLPGCIAALQQAAPTCLVPDACQGLLKGVTAPGQPCTQALECRNDTRASLCYRTADSATAQRIFAGVCQPAVRGTVGTPCVSSCGPGIDCSQLLYTNSATDPMAICFTEDGLYCESAACAPLIPAGAACTADPQCGTESYCDTTCTPRKTAGQPCLHDDECSQLAHLYCLNDVCSAASLASDQVCGGDLF